MNNLVKFFSLVCCVCMVGACRDNQQSDAKPPKIEDCVITPIHGGATITYTIPRDPNILYVMAEYVRNGEIFTERSSVYQNWLTIEGFNTTDPVSATLYTVSRDDEIKSDPLKVQFTPLESPISVTVNSIKITPTFGGIKVIWQNISKAELGVRLLVDSLGTMLEKELYFSSSEFEKHYFRGFENIETKFVLIFEDKWGNISKPVYETVTPFLEIEVEKPWNDMRALIPFDNTSEAGAAYTLSKAWDKAITNQNSYLNGSGTPGNSVTFDIKKVVKLSRMIFWNTYYTSDTYPTSLFSTCNITEFEMWGTAVLDNLKLSDRPYWLHPFSAAETHQPLPAHTFMDDWVYLGRFEIPTRTYLMSLPPADFMAALNAGWEFEFSDELTPVRYIRLFPLATANGGSPPARNNWWIAEMSFFGDDTFN